MFKNVEFSISITELALVPTNIGFLNNSVGLDAVKKTFPNLTSDPSEIKNSGAELINPPVQLL
jgi:hypothetical protein